MQDIACADRGALTLSEVAAKCTSDASCKSFTVFSTTVPRYCLKSAVTPTTALTSPAQCDGLYVLQRECCWLHDMLL